MQLNRAAFLAGSLAAGALLPKAAFAATGGESEQSAPPERLLGQLMAGNKRFVDNDFPAMDRSATRRELLVDSQAPFAAILGCADSRVIPNLIFVQGLGDLFVARVAGNFPDDLVTASLEYAVEHLGTRLVMVLGHQNCGAVKAVYSAIEHKSPLPPHLSTIERLIAPGIESVVAARGTLDAAIAANARASVQVLKTTPPVLAENVKSGKVLVVGGIYELGSGKVRLLE
ncbi:MAG TPA: carbonic anhydrase [Candidatus Binatia bacterium]|nr:carbonic anhydrase [Candidatus Binatia bacterium]